MLCLGNERKENNAKIMNKYFVKNLVGFQKPYTDLGKKEIRNKCSPKNTTILNPKVASIFHKGAPIYYIHHLATQT